MKPINSKTKGSLQYIIRIDQPIDFYYFVEIRGLFLYNQIY